MRQHLFGELLHEISFLYNDAVVSVNGAVVAVVEIQVVTVMVLLLQLWKFKSFFLWSSAVRSGEKKISKLSKPFTFSLCTGYRINNYILNS